MTQDPVWQLGEPMIQWCKQHGLIAKDILVDGFTCKPVSPGTGMYQVTYQLIQRDSDGKMLVDHDLDQVMVSSPRSFTTTDPPPRTERFPYE